MIEIVCRMWRDLIFLARLRFIFHLIIDLLNRKSIGFVFDQQQQRNSEIGFYRSISFVAERTNKMMKCRRRKKNQKFEKTIHLFCYSDYFVVIFPSLFQQKKEIVWQKIDEKILMRMVFDFKLQIISIMIDFFTFVYSCTMRNKKTITSAVQQSKITMSNTTNDNGKKGTDQRIWRKFDMQ